MADDSGVAAPDRRRSGRARRFVVAGLVAVLAAAAVLALVSSRFGLGCDASERYTVAVAPALAPVVLEVVEGTDTGCTTFEIVATEPGDVVARLGKGVDAPDLWIPEGGFWARRAQSTAAGQVRTLSLPLATSPLVLAGTPGSMPWVETWRSALGLPDLYLGNPLRSGTAAGAIRAALAETVDDPVAVGTVRTAMAVLAQRESARSDEAPTGMAMLDDMAASEVAVTTEQQVQHYRRTREGDLDARIPQNGSLMLDYPLVVAAPDPDRHTLAAAAGAALADALHTPEARTILSREGFRDSAGHALPDVRGLGTIPLLELRDDTIAEEALRGWSLLALPVRTLIAIDVSDSMNVPVEGLTRLELVAAAAKAADDLFPDSVSAGLWMFASDIDAEGRDFTEVAPVRRFDEVVDGRTQREIVMSLESRVPERIGHGTALFDTILAAYRAARDGYDPRAVNSVVVVTGGANDDPDGIGEDELLATLRNLHDPARPVRIVTVGVSPEADANTLAQISAVTGGSSYIADDPRDLTQILVNALADRSRR